jgi:site-specific DNA-methyltransferase (adenine-specific)
LVHVQDIHTITAERTSDPPILSVAVFGSEVNGKSVITTLADMTSPVEPLLAQCPFLHSGWFVSRPYEVLHGDARERVKSLPLPVDCVVTSPPYFAQRTYGDSTTELGKENTVDGYIASLVEVFASIPLQPWASVWVNIGDKRGKDACLLNIPKRFVLAMEAEGFRLIDEVIWVKEVAQVQGPPLGHGMIEPAPGRLNGNGHEPFYRFVRCKKDAWTDTCAVRVQRRNVEARRYLPEALMQCDTSVEGRNLGNVWLVPMGQTKRNHYAVFPPDLVERPIAMICPPAVTEMGLRDRIVEMVEYDDGQHVRRVGKYTKQDYAKLSGRQDTGRSYVPRKPVTRGWTLDSLPSRPGIVLDPFAGTGTTGEVAIKLGRLFIGIELYEQNVKMANERCENAARIYKFHIERLFAADANFTMLTGIPVPALGIASKCVGGHVLLSDSIEILPSKISSHSLAKIQLGDMNAIHGCAAE